MGSLASDRPDVMVIDDNLDIRDVIEAILEQEGYSVRLVGSCVEALELLRGGIRPRMILLDLSMPELSGWGFATELADDPVLRNIPVAVMTGQPAYRGVPYRSRDAGVFRKPLDFDALLACVKSVTSDVPWRLAAPRVGRVAKPRDY